MQPPGLDNADSDSSHRPPPGRSCVTDVSRDVGVLSSRGTSPLRLHRRGHTLSMFTVGCLFAGLSIDSDEVPGLGAQLASVLGTSFTVSAGATAAVHLRVVQRDRFSIDSADLAAARRAPQLWLSDEGPRFVVLARHPDRTILLRDGEQDASPVLLTVSRPASSLICEVVDDRMGSLRALLRLVHFILGAQLCEAGVPLLHAAAVAHHGLATLIVGPTNAGKSSLAFLATTVGGAQFLADDLVLACDDKVVGWPQRLGINIELLEGHPARHVFESTPLRRYHGPVGPLPTTAPTPWTRAGRRRLYCDVDEFAAITGVTVVKQARTAGMVIPVADKDRSGWSITPLTPGPAVAPVIDRHLRHFIDHLGLLPPAVVDLPRRTHTLAGLSALPTVQVAYGRDVNARFPQFWSEVMAMLDQQRHDRKNNNESRTDRGELSRGEGAKTAATEVVSQR